MTTPAAPEDHRRSLADLAQRDLDAALQLLAERAQYITAASGAAIALRRGDHHDMLCRASAGSNAPELGAILSMDYGLSGESVRTRQLLRCDDVSTDSRVNHEVCRRLGIASVVVMPIVSDDQTLGVFELLSGKPRAFEERDLSALRRLSELVEHAVKHAVLAHFAPSAAEIKVPETTADSEPSPTLATSIATVEQVSTPANVAPADPVSATLSASPAPGTLVVPIIPTPELPAAKSADPIPTDKTETVAEKFEPEKFEPEKLEPEKPALSPTKPRFWSLAIRSDSSPTAPSAESARVPPGLRNLQKCQACGFPVSPGRTYCVECEEKQWRGLPLTKPATSATPPASAKTGPDIKSQKIAAPSAVTTKSVETADPETPPKAAAIPATPAPPASPAPAATPPLAPIPAKNSAENLPLPESFTLFQSSAAPTESWIAANKYVLSVLLVVAIIIAAIAYLR